MGNNKDDQIGRYLDDALKGCQDEDAGEWIRLLVGVVLLSLLVIVVIVKVAH